MNFRVIHVLLLAVFIIATFLAHGMTWKTAIHEGILTLGCTLAIVAFIENGARKNQGESEGKQEGK